MKSYRQLTPIERYQISALIKAGHRQNEIAKILKRSRSTISRELARNEGLLVDPAYSGKGFAALLDRIRRGHLSADEDVVFVHTGGTPLTFVYGEELL